ncbi:MAG TPA: hypothetical protein VL137_10890 [Polyangiaceae bacterium]|jgi:hypothetical protein|nr:hypothetical protein [Polyangiaceae bacterium]
MALPETLQWLFWEFEPAALDVQRHADQIIPRVLEKGRLEDVRWLIATYSLDRIHTFLRQVGHPELSKKTLTFWRCVLGAENEQWKTPPTWRQSSSAPWIS